MGSALIEVMNIIIDIYVEVNRPVDHIVVEFSLLEFNI
jgi:hypothetical protein